MYDTIVVPLDGSFRAELALPMAVEEARRYRAALVLIHVLPRPEPPTWPVSGGHPEVDGTRVIGAELPVATHLGRQYLDHVVKRFRLPQWTTTIVVIGEPFNEILSVARRLPRPLIVVAIVDTADVTCPSISDAGKRLLEESPAPTLGVRITQASWGSVPPQVSSSREEAD